MKKKLMYETPDVEVIECRVQKALLASDFETEQLREGNTNWWNDNDED